MPFPIAVPVCQCVVGWAVPVEQCLCSTLTCGALHSVQQHPWVDLYILYNRCPVQSIQSSSYNSYTRCAASTLWSCGARLQSSTYSSTYININTLPYALYVPPLIPHSSLHYRSMTTLGTSHCSWLYHSSYHHDYIRLFMIILDCL